VPLTTEGSEQEETKTDSSEQEETEDDDQTGAEPGVRFIKIMIKQHMWI